MKLFKIIALFTVYVVLLTSFIQCKSLKESSNLKNNKQDLKLEDKASFNLNDTYFQSWVAGVRGGGSGIHLYVSILNNKNNVLLDSAYFRGMQSKIKLDNTLYIASFKTVANKKNDIIMSNNKNAEYGNTLPNKKFPFELKENECVISYIENNTTKYLLLENLIEKKRVEYPKARKR